MPDYSLYDPFLVGGAASSNASDLITSSALFTDDFLTDDIISTYEYLPTAGNGIYVSEIPASTTKPANNILGDLFGSVGSAFEGFVGQSARSLADAAIEGLSYRLSSQQVSNDINRNAALPGTQTVEQTIGKGGGVSNAAIGLGIAAAGVAGLAALAYIVKKA